MKTESNQVNSFPYNLFVSQAGQSQVNFLLMTILLSVSVFAGIKYLGDRASCDSPEPTKSLAGELEITEACIIENSPEEDHRITPLAELNSVNDLISNGPLQGYSTKTPSSSGGPCVGLFTIFSNPYPSTDLLTVKQKSDVFNKSCAGSKGVGLVCHSSKSSNTPLAGKCFFYNADSSAFLGQVKLPSWLQSAS